MSASLVGSEMCIRDSASQVKVQAGLAGPLRQPSARRCATTTEAPGDWCACLLYTSDAADDM
eukprot:9899995-Alexandrium_andersonii.AAC.1